MSSALLTWNGTGQLDDESRHGQNRGKVISNNVTTACALCGNVCLLSVEVSAGTITKIRPADSLFGEDRGGCRLGLAGREIVYHPDRLQYPMKRVGPRGGGEWRRISWDEALAEIADKITHISAAHGQRAVAWHIREYPRMRAGGYHRLASLTGGTWIKSYGMGDAAGPCADLSTFGSLYGSLTWALPDPKLCLVWGSNPAVTDKVAAKTLADVRKKGCRVVVIDPRTTTTARLADEHVAIGPGTDGALAMGMIHLIIGKGIYDRRFTIDHTVGPLLVREDSGLFLRERDVRPSGDPDRFMVCDGNTKQGAPACTPDVQPILEGSWIVAGVKCTPAFQLLADEVRAYPPERVAEITGMPAHVIERLAVEYATHKPAAIHRGWGMQRTFYGDLACRAINTMAAITGNIDLSSQGKVVLNWRPFLLPGKPLTELSAVELYDAISRGQPWPVKAFWVAGHNFVNQMPNMNRFVNEVLPGLELLVVCDLFVNATAKYADYVLPAASSYECIDLFGPVGREISYLALQQRVIEPLSESKSDFQIAAGLGRRLGLGEHFDKTEEQYLAEVLDSGHPSVQGATLEALSAGPVRVTPSEAPRKFRTPTGRIEFYVEKLKPFGQERPTYLEPLESALTEKSTVYPLIFLTTHSKDRANSVMANVSKLSNRDPEPRLEINPADAGARLIKDGDEVRVFNDRGGMRLKAKVTKEIMPGVVNVEQGWWPEHYVEGHHNQLTHDFINPAQKIVDQPNVAYYDVLVEVEKHVE